MPIAQNGRGVLGLRYVAPDGHEYPPILLAYLGSDVVWDGHVHQTVQVQAAAAAAVIPSVQVLADANVSVQKMSALVGSDAHTVVGSSAPAVPVMAATGAGFGPVMHGGHHLAASTAQVDGAMLEPVIKVVFGQTPPTMTAQAVFEEPVQVHADSVVYPPTATAYTSMHSVTAGAYAFVTPPEAAVDAVFELPVVHADVNTVPPTMVSTADGLEPAVHADSLVQPPTATATGAAPVPQIKSNAVPVFHWSDWFDGQSNTQFTVNIPSSDACLIVVSTSNRTEYGKVDGNNMVLQGRTSDEEVAMYTVLGLSPGNHSVDISRDGSGSYLVGAAIYTGVSMVSGSSGDTGTNSSPEASPTGSGGLAFAGFNVGVSDVNEVTAQTGTTIRTEHRRTSSNTIVLADREGTSPVELTTVSSDDWSAMSVWLT